MTESPIRQTQYISSYLFPISTFNWIKKGYKLGSVMRENLKEKQKRETGETLRERTLCPDTLEFRLKVRLSGKQVVGFLTPSQQGAASLDHVIPGNTEKELNLYVSQRRALLEVERVWYVEEEKIHGLKAKGH